MGTDDDFPINTRVFWPVDVPRCHGRVIGTDGDVYRLITDCRGHGQHTSAMGLSTQGVVTMPRSRVALDRRAG